VNPLFSIAHWHRGTASMTSVVLIRARSPRLGVVTGCVQFDDSIRGWPQPGVSTKRGKRQNSQKECPKFLQ
jgi:hypothetical protein